MRASLGDAYVGAAKISGGWTVMAMNGSGEPVEVVRIAASAAGSWEQVANAITTTIVDPKLVDIADLRRRFALHPQDEATLSEVEEAPEEQRECL